MFYPGSKRVMVERPVFSCGGEQARGCPLGRQSAAPLAGSGLANRLVIALIAIAVAAVMLFSGLSSVQAAYADESALAAGSGDRLLSVQSTIKAQAAQKWKTIKTPEQLRVLNLKSEGFGPGYYKLGADFTLGEEVTGDRIATCALLSGNFVIDFNGHTVQSAGKTLATFTVQGANVTFFDSKATSSTIAIRSYGAYGIEVRSGSATVLNGNYTCQLFDPGGSAVAVSGGSCTVNGGAFSGTVCAISNMGGQLTVNGGDFYGGYPYALLQMAGTTKIVKGTFQGARNTYGYAFPIGAMSLGNTYDMNSLLASGSSWSTPFTTAYYSGTSYAAYQPYYPVRAGYYTVNTPLNYAVVPVNGAISVNGTVGEQLSSAVMAPTIKKLASTKKKQATVKWGKVSGSSKYQVRYSTKKNMKSAKVVDVSNKKASLTVKKLKRNKKYYVQMRAYRNIGGVTYYSAWGGKKQVKVK